MLTTAKLALLLLVVCMSSSVNPVVSSLNVTVACIVSSFVGVDSWKVIEAVSFVRSIVSSLVVVSVPSFPTWSMALACTLYTASGRVVMVLSARVHVVPPLFVAV